MNARRSAEEPQVWRTHGTAYDCVTYGTKSEAIKRLGTTDIHLYGDPDLTRRAKRHKGEVLRRVRGVRKSRYEVW